MNDSDQTTTANLDFAAKEAAPFQPLVQLTERACSESVEQPDYLPARMLNEFVYCPRLFYYEWVEGVFVNSVDTVAGSLRQPRFGRPALALDLMEPFRPLIADSAVLSAINTRMITPRDFIRTGQAVALTPDGRKAFYRAYEQRMDTLVTHPLFGYRVTYRRVLEIQTRLLARLLTGEIRDYPPFITR